MRRPAKTVHVLAVSGGLDTSCLWYILGKPRAIHVHGVNRPESGARELDALYAQMEICPDFRRALKLVEIDCGPFVHPTHPRALPREQIIGMAAWAAGFNGVAFGFCREDGVSDAWCERLAAKVKAAVAPMNATPPDDPFDVLFPARDLTKKQLIKLARDAGAPAEFIKASYSCVRGGNPCGECRNCKDRKAAGMRT